MARISIVIPSMKHLEDCLKPCCESIILHTDLEDVEVIVVLNGCGDDGSKEYIESLTPAFRTIWLDEPGGYTHSTNVGIAAATGEYLILLNNDCVITGPDWLGMLGAPFIDPTVGITGPLQLHCPDADRDFLVFFCVMVRRVMLDRIGGLDEIFQPGYGEDCDLCCRAVDNGWKVVQVPDGPAQLVDKGCEDLPEWKRAKMWSNGYPIYHDGNKTFGEHFELYDNALRKNAATLRERYRKPMVNIERAKTVDGWFAESELSYVAQQATHCKTVIEIGSWHGRSSRGIADNLPEGGQLWCCDSWQGSSGEPEMHFSAKLREGDHAHQWWWCNLHDLIVAGKVIPIRMQSVNAAETLSHLGLKADMVFIDAAHDYNSVQADILAWRHVIKDGGLWCGHDYYTEGQEPFAWVGVRACVTDMFPDVQQVPGTSIWWSRSKPIVKSHVYDCFVMTGDLDAVERRFQAMDSVVDRWVIVEGRQTLAGDLKPLYFSNNLERFRPWVHKVTHLAGFDFPGDVDDFATRERWLYDNIMPGLNDCHDDDEVIIGDVDWIPKSIYHLPTVPYKTVKELKPSGVRFGNGHKG